jgi:putative peptidoglycan lipid II flippase
MDLPLGVIAVAFGTVLLPTFSGFFARGDGAGAKKAFTDSVGNMMLLMIPASVGMFVLAPELTSAVYEGSAFDATASARVSRALAVYASGLAFFGYQKAAVPWFQAQSDMKTPLSVSVKMVFLNAFLNILAVWLLPVEWRHAGLAASTVFCAAAGCVCLTAIMRRNHGNLGFVRLSWRICRIGAAAGAMAAALIALKFTLSGLCSLAALAVEVVVGASVYAAAVYCLGERCFPLRRP